jgi:hypothetical protein
MREKVNLEVGKTVHLTISYDNPKTGVSKRDDGTEHQWVAYGVTESGVGKTLFLPDAIKPVFAQNSPKRGVAVSITALERKGNYDVTIGGREFKVRGGDTIETAGSATPTPQTPTAASSSFDPFDLMGRCILEANAAFARGYGEGYSPDNVQAIASTLFIYLANHPAEAMRVLAAAVDEFSEPAAA